MITVYGLRAEPVGWAIGLVGIRTRGGELDLELRRQRYYATLETAARALAAMAQLQVPPEGDEGQEEPFAGVLELPMAIEQLERVRLVRGMTRQEWAERAGVNVRTIRRLLNEGQDPKLTTLRKLRGAL